MPTYSTVPNVLVPAWPLSYVCSARFLVGPCRIIQPAKAYLHAVLLSTLIPRRGDTDTRRPCWAIYPAGLWFHWAGEELLSLCVSLCTPRAAEGTVRKAAACAMANECESVALPGCISRMEPAWSYGGRHAKKGRMFPLLPVDTALEALHPRCSPCAAERARVKVGPGACTSDTRPGHIQRGYADGVTKSPGGGEGATAGPITG